jgi:hypothetical protein
MTQCTTYRECGKNRTLRAEGIGRRTGILRRLAPLLN